MTAPTPAVERAESAIYSTIWGGPRDDDRFPDEEEYEGARTVLTAALTDPDDPDSLARTLFVLWAVAEEPNDWAFGATEATIWWSDMPEHKRVHWRAVADGLRLMLTGSAS